MCARDVITLCRLILSYHRVGIQTKNLDLANGVVGVVDSKSLPVLNTKQDFNQNSQHFVTLERHLAEIVEHYYWNFVNPDVKVATLTSCTDSQLMDLFANR